MLAAAARPYLSVVLRFAGVTAIALTAAEWTLRKDYDSLVVWRSMASLSVSDRDGGELLQRYRHGI